MAQPPQHPREEEKFRAHSQRLSHERAHAQLKLRALQAACASTPHADSITTTIDFVLPNLRPETIRAGKYWFSPLTTVTPITRNQCRIDVVAAWNIFRWLPFGPELLKFVFAKFVEQDRRTMELQAEGLKHNPHLMLIDDADRPAKWYFQLKAAHLEAKRTGAEMKHPMAGPVTLKWRS